MTIKSLLLGSAAALVAVSGARAADVVVVEPEPVEYVRVCDVYGTGFFYIPGTETCMRIGGYVRMQINVQGEPLENLEGDDYRTFTQTRVRLNFDVREETELGLLRAYARVQAQNNAFGNADADNGTYEMTQGYVQLGGLQFGYYDSLWTSDLGGIEDGLLTDTDLAIGDVSRNTLSYTFAAGGVSAVVALEDDGTGDFVPDVHGKLAYAGAWGGAYISAVYDETFNIEDSGDFFFDPTFDADGNIVDFDDSGFGFGLAGLSGVGEDGDDGAFALKAGIKLSDILTEGSQLAIEGTYAFDPTSYSVFTDLVPAITDDIPLFVEWSIGAGYEQEVGDFTVGVAGQYGELFEATYVTGFDPLIGDAGAFTTATTDGEYYSLVGNVGYNFTNNFGALAEIQYTDIDAGELGSVDNTRGFLRLTRTF